jgi:hypothetical protein
LAIAGVAEAQVRVAANKENVVASRLEGRWEPDSALTLRLGGRGGLGDGPAVPGSRVVAFQADSTVAARITGEMQKALQEKPIYQSGTLEMGGRRYPYILTELHGNPHVVFFRARREGGDPFEDAESFNVMLAPSREPANDLLLIGGDFNNQPFTAYRRVRAGG